MGQYHFVVNYDRREFLHPHKFNDGLKLMEFGVSANATMTALAVLLAASCQGGARGGGDIHPWEGGPGYEGRSVPGLTPGRSKWLMDNVVGRWAGQRVAVIGDYAEDTDAGGLVEREGAPWKDGGDNNLVANTGAALRSGVIPPAEPWVDISHVALEAIEMDYYVYDARHTVA